MPAPAVIPAPIAYVNVVAVKKLVVEFLAEEVQSHWFSPQAIRLKILMVFYRSSLGSGILL